MASLKPMTNYFADMAIIDERLKRLENRLEFIEIALRQLNVIKEKKEKKGNKTK